MWRWLQISSSNDRTTDWGFEFIFWLLFFNGQNEVMARRALVDAWRAFSSGCFTGWPSWAFLCAREKAAISSLNKLQAMSCFNARDGNQSIYWVYLHVHSNRFVHKSLLCPAYTLTLFPPVWMCTVLICLAQLLALSIWHSQSQPYSAVCNVYRANHFICSFFCS